MADPTAGEMPATPVGETPAPAAGEMPSTQPQDTEGLRKALDAERLARRDAEHKLKTFEVEARRRDVAASKGVPAQLLSGSTIEELEAHADLLIEFRGGKPALGDPKGKPDDGAKPAPVGRPKENLVPGAAPQADSEPDMGKIADQIFRRGRL